MNFVFVCLLLLVTILSDNDILWCSNLNLWILVLFIGYNTFKDRFVSLINMFVFGFIYIYFKEFLNDVPNLYLDWGIENVNTGYYVIMYSFITLLSGYFMRDLIKVRSDSKGIDNDFNFIKSKSKFFKINILSVYLIFIGNILIVVEGLTEGRPNSLEYGFFSYLSYALAIIIIINLKLYYKQFYGKYNLRKVLICTFPLFILFFASGTRYLLLYGVIALISNELYNLTNVKIFKIAIFVLIFGFLGNLVLDLRNIGFLNSSAQSNVSLQENSKTFNQIVVHKFTNEGLLRNVSMITDYANKKDYTYGKSFGFLLYWWVPRFIWEGKPTHIDYWLIREYTSEYDDSGYSTASGFMGELYMDFGKYFVLPFMFAFGWLFSFLNFKYFINYNKFNYFSVVLNGSILAWIFFSVRSIMVSSFTLFFIILATYLINKYFKKWNILN